VGIQTVIYLENLGGKVCR